MNVNEERLYNSAKKIAYLKNYDDTETAQNYLRIFNYTSELEKKRNKDLCDFTLDDVAELCFEIEFTKANSAKSFKSVLRGYARYALENGFKETDVNQMEDITPKWLKQFTKNQAVHYFSESKITEIEEWCENYQDKFLIRGLFEGIMGDGCFHLLNLKKSDILADEKALRLTNGDGSQFKYYVSDKLIKIATDAANQKMYKKRNGKISVKAKNERKEVKLVDNDYVIRNSITHTTFTNTPAKINIIYSRIKNIRELNSYEYLKPLDIYHSGIVKYAEEIKGNDELDKEHLQKIADKYGARVVNLKLWLNEGLINTLY